MHIELVVPALLPARDALAEALLGVTRHAATALGLLDSHGTIELAKAADLCLWNVDPPAELA